MLENFRANVLKLPFETKDSKHLVGTNMVTIRQL